MGLPSRAAPASLWGKDALGPVGVGPSPQRDPAGTGEGFAVEPLDSPSVPAGMAPSAAVGAGPDRAPRDASLIGMIYRSLHIQIKRTSRLDASTLRVGGLPSTRRAALPQCSSGSAVLVAGSPLR